MTLRLFDTNNYARIAFEVDPGGFPLRKLFQEAFHHPSPQVYFFDGMKSKTLRLEKFPLYKSGRQKGSDNFYVMLGTFKELLMHTNNVIVEVPGYEADDVIATFAKLNPTMEIVIESTDRDFCALQRAGLTTPKANLKGVPPEDVRLHKTLCGDTGDTISGIVGFGKKAWEVLTTVHKAEWITYFEADGIHSYPLDMRAYGLSKPSHIKWFEENPELLRTFWQIIGFYDVPHELIGKHTRVGTANYKRGDEILREILQ